MNGYRITPNGLEEIQEDGRPRQERLGKLLVANGSIRAARRKLPAACLRELRLWAEALAIMAVVAAIVFFFITGGL